MEYWKLPAWAWTWISWSVETKRVDVVLYLSLASWRHHIWGIHHMPFCSCSPSMQHLLGTLLGQPTQDTCPLAVRCSSGFRSMILVWRICIPCWRNPPSGTGHYHTFLLNINRREVMNTCMWYFTVHFDVWYRFLGKKDHRFRVISEILSSLLQWCRTDIKAIWGKLASLLRHTIAVVHLVDNFDIGERHHFPEDTSDAGF